MRDARSPGVSIRVFSHGDPDLRQIHSLSVTQGPGIDKLMCLATLADSTHDPKKPGHTFKTLFLHESLKMLAILLSWPYLISLFSSHMPVAPTKMLHKHPGN